MSIFIHVQAVVAQIDSKVQNENETKKYLSEKITIENFIIYQLYQETKCTSWKYRIQIPESCLTQLPTKKEGKYHFVFKTTFLSDDKDQQKRFLTFDESRKRAFIKDTAVYFLSNFQDYIDDEIYFPESNGIHLDKVKSKVKKIIDLEIYFNYGPKNRYKANINSNSDVEIKKYTFYPDNL